MNIFKRLAEKRKERKALKEKENSCWYNNAHEKKRRRWNPPADGGCYDSANHEIATTNSIAKRQH